MDSDQQLLRTCLLVYSFTHFIQYLNLWLLLNRRPGRPVEVQEEEKPVYGQKAAADDLTRIEQADLAAKRNWNELERLQGKLKGGRRK